MPLSRKRRSRELDAFRIEVKLKLNSTVFTFITNFLVIAILINRGLFRTLLMPNIYDRAF